jgi:hypothetical protein
MIMTMAEPSQTPAILTVDVKRWPIVVLTCVGSATDEQLNEHLREIEEKVLARAKPFVQIIDQRRAEWPNAIQRGIIADHQARMDAVYRKYCLGEAYIVNAEWRKAMTAVFWLAKPPYPYVFLDTFDQATEWANARIKEAAAKK